MNTIKLPSVDTDITYIAMIRQIWTFTRWVAHSTSRHWYLGKQDQAKEESAKCFSPFLETSTDQELPSDVTKFITDKRCLLLKLLLTIDASGC